MSQDSVTPMSNGTAVALSAGLIVAGWFVYDLLWLSPLAKNEAAGVVISYLLLSASIYGFTRLYAGRAAYIEARAMLGQSLALDVWWRLPPPPQHPPRCA